ncbi:MAG: hypothetical protein Q8P10_01115 [bacterium]|nr:hypothetical protein [bacterium]
MKKLIFPLWVISAITLFLYSFTQVDLSLTLSQISIWQTLQNFFQQIGWFNRPLSAILFVSVVLLLFVLYGFTLKVVRKGTLGRSDLWKIIIVVSVILFFAYNAFSYDLFNYIFDAKILVHYNQNPYEHKALDYPNDPMLSFMRWTHRTYPYGPVWLFITVPIYFIGFGYFLLTFYLFKLLMALSFIGSVFFIEKIARKTIANPNLAVAAFALNPLVLVESLVSAHNDIVMIFLALVAVYTFIEGRYIKSFLFLLASILLKYATVLIIPGLFIKKILNSNNSFFYTLIVSMSVAVLFATYRTNFQPWYLLFVLPFTAFVYEKYFISIPVFIISFFALLQYLPFIYLGNWNPPVPSILNWMMVGSAIVSVVLMAWWKFSKREGQN